MKPLFFPLRTEWFLAFERGEKRVEYRRAGPRWNARTCEVGRAVTLSHGYSGRRLHGSVACFDELSLDDCPDAVRALYHDASAIAAVTIHLSSDSCTS